MRSWCRRCRGLQRAADVGRRQRLKGRIRYDPNLQARAAVPKGMTCYVANHQKKIGIFHKRERALVHAIKHQLADDKIAVAAERVRQAKLSVFKCRFTKNSERQPYSFSAQKF